MGEEEDSVVPVLILMIYLIAFLGILVYFCVVYYDYISWLHDRQNGRENGNFKSKENNCFRRIKVSKKASPAARFFGMATDPLLLRNGENPNHLRVPELEEDYV